jgi:hypothetical protein
VHRFSSGLEAVEGEEEMAVYAVSQSFRFTTIEFLKAA